MAADPVTVIIVVHGGEHVGRCLGSLAAQSLLPDRIILLDTASPDDAVAASRRAIAADPRLAGRAEVRPLGANLGFAAACNIGLALADTPLVALLNPDAFAEPEWLARLVAAAAAHPAAAAFGSRQMLAEQPDVLDGLGDCYHLAGLAWRGGHGRRLRPADLEGREIFSACAAAALYRRDAVLGVGGFDEVFFCYMEDVDLGFRLRLAGHTARSVPDAVVHHVGAASSRGDGGRTAAYFGHRNRIWTHVANMPAPLLAASLPLHVFLTILAGVVLTARGHGGEFVRATAAAIGGLPAAWRKRRRVQASRVASTAAIWRMLDKSLWRR